MTRDEARAKCIKAMDMAVDRAIPSLNYVLFEAHITADIWGGAMAAAFDALHGLVTVNSSVPTGEMMEAARRECDEAYRIAPRGIPITDILIVSFKAMSATGDLTNPPEDRYDPPFGDYGLNNPPETKP